MTPNEILNKSFTRATVGGYKADEVNEFLQEISRTTDMLYLEKNDLEKKLVVLADKLEEYRSDEESMRSALLGAQKLGDSILKDSKEKSEELLGSALKESEDIITRAQMESEKIKKEAQKQYERETYVLNQMKREVSKFKKQILALYKQHITLIEALPYEEFEEEKDEEEPRLVSPLVSNIRKNQQNFREDPKIIEVEILEEQTEYIIHEETGQENPTIEEPRRKHANFNFRPVDNE